jgi:hypothetical protein
VAILINASIVLVVLIILLFVGFKWVKPQILRLQRCGTGWNSRCEARMSWSRPNTPSNARDLGGLRTLLRESPARGVRGVPIATRQRGILTLHWHPRQVQPRHRYPQIGPEEVT